MNFSIKRRIYWSFFLLVLLFLMNGIVTFITLIKNQKLSSHIYGVIDPSLRVMDDFDKMLVGSKMYCTNWVFLRSGQSDKDALLALQNVDYPVLKRRLNACASKWEQQQLIDSLHTVFGSFEQLLSIEKKITGSLVKFEDYNDPFIKLEAERIVEDEVLPRTAALISSLRFINYKMQAHKNGQEIHLKNSSGNLRVLIVTLSIITFCTGLFLSVYMTRIITGPINEIRQIVNGLGKGIIRKVQYAKKNEIGGMIASVNNLSEKLLTTATFAHEVGLRNFDIPFQPLSDEDMLGKAIISMRDNLKASETELHEINVNLVQRNKELEQFAFMVSHNLRAPVANIIGFTHVLNALGKNVDQKQRDMLNALSISAEKLDEIIVDLNRLLQQRRLNDEKEDHVSFSKKQKLQLNVTG
jgi:phospho-acceptor domain-containing protein